MWEGTMERKRLARRRVMALGLGGAALGLGTNVLIGRRRAMAASNPETMVYVSNAGSKEIYVLAMDRQTGATRHRCRAPTNRRRRACR
jgi:hypothetical protein